MNLASEPGESGDLKPSLEDLHLCAFGHFLKQAPIRNTTHEIKLGDCSFELQDTGFVKPHGQYSDFLVSNWAWNVSMKIRVWHADALNPAG